MNGKRWLGWLSECRERAVVIVSCFFVLWRIYFSPHNDENGKSALILGVMTILMAILGEPGVPTSLTRNGSSGLFYGLILVPAVFLGISEQCYANKSISELMQSLTGEQVKVCVWISLFMYFPRFKMRSPPLGYYMQSLVLFIFSGLTMQYLLKLQFSFPLLIQTAVSLSLAKVTSLRLPNCFTCGELLLITNLLMSLLSNYHEIPSCIEICLIANYLLLFVTFFLLSLIPAAVFRVTSVKLFYSSGIILLLSLLYKLSELLPISLISWVSEFLQANWPYRAGLLFLWTTEILICVLYVIVYRPLAKKSSTAERKLFHIIILVTFLPAMYLDIPMIFICSVGATCVLVMIEVMRALNIPPFAGILNERFIVFVDSQDQGHLILTPIYLLLGQSLPIWGACLQEPSLLYGSTSVLPFAAFSGILSVAVGDTAASVIGSTYGKVRWSNSRKTVEGTTAAILSQIVAALVLHSGVVTLPQISAIIAISLIEAYTSQIDNLILPVYMFFLLNT